MTCFIHDLADVQTANIGSGTRIWQYAVILKGARIGKDCNINCHTFIENDVVIGDNVTVKSGVYIWDNIEIEDNVFIGPQVVFTNDLKPRSRVYKDFERTIIKKGASLGASTTVLAGVTIGEYALSGIGSVITRDVPPYALVYGNPARFHGWIDEHGEKLVNTEGDIWTSGRGGQYLLLNGIMKKL